MPASPSKPTIVLAMGDPAGISPELTAKALVDGDVRAAAHFVVIGDRRVLAQGAADAKVALDIDVISPTASVPHGPGRPVLVDLGHCDPKSIQRSVVQLKGGQSAVENIKTALGFAVGGCADAVCFTPFNKAAMRLAHPGYEDEIVFTKEMLNSEGRAVEFNVLEGLWNARVTSHVPLSGVAPLITAARILENLQLTDQALRAAGLAEPRIGVAALNPHAGDNGNFGREEIDVIEPAVKAGQAAGINCSGPFPSDTVFVRAKRGQFDAVLTMYHDQGQIAMKLLGFEDGVTLLGGFPFPYTTPAHGTAYDIAGKGIANLGATKAAVLLAARMARARVASGNAAKPTTAARSAAELRRLITA